MRSPSARSPAWLATASRLAPPRIWVPSASSPPAFATSRRAERKWLGSSRRRRPRAMAVYGTKPRCGDSGTRLLLLDDVTGIAGALEFERQRGITAGHQASADQDMHQIGLELHQEAVEVRDGQQGHVPFGGGALEAACHFTQGV